jgi:hypothetical protein
MRTHKYWPLTTPRAWRGPVASLATGALLSLPAVASAPAACAAPLGSATPGVHQTPLVRGASGSGPAAARGARASDQSGVRAGASRTAAIAGLRLAPASGRAAEAPDVTAKPGPSARPLSGTGFDGMLVAAIGTAVAGAGWLVLLAAGRRQRRRSR